MNGLDKRGERARGGVCVEGLERSARSVRYRTGSLVSGSVGEESRIK